jgi:Flp pilus assembly pilin Flp
LLYTVSIFAARFGRDAEEITMLKYLFEQLDRMDPNKEKGQDLAEYSLFLGLIALVVVISVTLIGTQISDIFIAIATAIVNGIWIFLVKIEGKCAVGIRLFSLDWILIHCDLDEQPPLLTGADLVVGSGWINCSEASGGKLCVLTQIQKTKPISRLANGFGVPNFRLGLRTGHKQK